MTGKIHTMDVHFNDFGIKGFTAAVVHVHRSWDGSWWAETNVKALCGPDRVVFTGDRNRVAQINWEPLNCPARIIR